MRETSLSKKFFAEGQISPTKKLDEESRFGDLSTEEIQEILHNAFPVTTKKKSQLQRSG